MVVRWTVVCGRRWQPEARRNQGKRPELQSEDRGESPEESDAAGGPVGDWEY